MSVRTPFVVGDDASAVDVDADADADAASDGDVVVAAAVVGDESVVDAVMDELASDERDVGRGGEKRKEKSWPEDVNEVEDEPEIGTEKQRKRMVGSACRNTHTHSAEDTPDVHTDHQNKGRRIAAGNSKRQDNHEGR